MNAGRAAGLVIACMLALTACANEPSPPSPSPSVQACGTRPSDPAKLLRRHAPVLRLDSRERYLPTTVESFVNDRSAILHRADDIDGEVIATGADAIGRLTVQLLAVEPDGNGGLVYRNGTRVRAGDTVSVPDVHALHQDAPVAYSRVVIGGDCRVYLQYWLFWINNDVTAGLGDGLPGRVADAIVGAVGAHPGDWELIQFRMDAGTEQVERVTLSQHKGSETREGGAVELRHGRVVVYPALLTHANMFTPAAWTLDAGTIPDYNDGRGREITPSVIELDRVGWRAWPGRIGTITMPVTRPHYRRPEAWGARS